MRLSLTRVDATSRVVSFPPKMFETLSTRRVAVFAILLFALGRTDVRSLSRPAIQIESDDFILSVRSGDAFSRVEITSADSCDEDEDFFTATIVRHDQEKPFSATDLVFGQLEYFPNFPGGRYDVMLRGKCRTFSYEDLLADYTVNGSGRVEEYCPPFTRLNTTRRIPSRQVPIPICFDTSVASSHGYWKHHAWSPSKCKYPDKAESFLMTNKIQRKKIIVYIAGDSVSRGMFGEWCALIAANSRWAFDSKTISRVTRQHCCRGDFCLFHVFTWFPLPLFFPPKFKTTYPNVSSYCPQESQTGKKCRDSVPDFAFAWDKNMSDVEIWHWMFYGSHSPVYGASNSSCQKILESGLTFNLDYERILVFGTPAVQESRIPEKYLETQAKTRTNVRILSRNKALCSCLPTNSFVDLFPMTFALKSTDYNDAIHFGKAYKRVAGAIWQMFILARSS